MNAIPLAISTIIIFCTACYAIGYFVGKGWWAARPKPLINEFVFKTDKTKDKL